MYGRPVKYMEGEGRFIQFGVDTTRGFGSYSVAIIEKSDGTVVMAGFGQFQFTDKQPANGPTEKANGPAEELLKRFPCFKVPDGMELIEWGKNECPDGCYLVAFEDGDKEPAPLIVLESTGNDYDNYFLIRPKQ